MNKDDCIFCKIISGDIPCFKIYESDNVIAFLDRYPSSLGHTLIVPKNHCQNIFDLECDEDLFATAKKISIKLKQHLQFDGLNILQNNGEAAGQTVHHLHIHLIPRYSKDNINISWDSTNPETSNFVNIQNLIKF